MGGLERRRGGRAREDSVMGTVTIRREEVKRTSNEALSGLLERRRGRILLPEALARLCPASTGREQVGAHVLIDFAS